MTDIGILRIPVVPNLAGFGAKLSAGLAGVEKATTPATASAARLGGAYDKAAVAAQRAGVQMQAAALRSAAAQDKAAAATAKLAAAQAEASTAAAKLYSGELTVAQAAAKQTAATEAATRATQAQGQASIAAQRLILAQGAAEDKLAGQAAAAGAAQVKAADEAAAARGRAVASVAGFASKIGAASAAITVGLGFEGVKSAVKFQTALTRVSTQANVSQKDLKGLGDALLNLSPKVGFNPDELASSLYHVESAFHSTGITAAAATAIVEQASKLAKIGNADLESTTQAVIGVLSSHIKGIRDAADAAAQLNQLVGAGDTTLSKVDAAIGTGILPTSEALGLSFKDVSAALATLTDNATPADEAATRLRTTFSLIEKPTSAARTALKEIGITGTQLAEDFRQPDGLLVAITDLQSHLKASGKTATEQAQLILSAFGGAKSGATFLTLYREIDRLKSKYEEFGTSAQAANKFQAAWVQQQTTARQKVDDLKASWDVFLVKIGNAILPDLKKIVDVLAQHPGILKGAAAAIGIFAAAWAAVKIGGIISALGRMATAILGVGTASATAAAESSAAGLGAGAAAGAGAAGAARAATGAFAAGGAAGAGSSALFAGLEKSALTKIAIPVGLVVVGADLAKSLDKAARDIQHGHATDGIAKILGSKFAEGITFGLSGGIAKAIKSGDWVKALGPGAGLLQKALGGALPGGKLTGELAKGFGQATGLAKNFWGTLDDRVRISQFQTSLQNANVLLQSNTRSLQGNSQGAKSNREGLTKLVVEAEAAAHAYANTTGKQSDYTNALRLAIPQIEDAAAATGLNRAQVDKLVTSILGVPLQTENEIKVSGYLEALNAVNNYLAAIHQIPEFVTTYINAVATGTTQSVPGGTQGTLGGLFGAGAAGQKPLHPATGGWIFGPGSGTSDSIPAMVSNGEFVVKASAAQKNSRLLETLNSGGSIGGPAVHIEHWHGDQTDADGLASMIVAKQRAYAASKGI